MDHQQHPTSTSPGESPPDPGLTEDRDTGDLIDPDAPDPIPEEVTDPADPSWVEPAADAVPVDPARLLPANPYPPYLDNPEYSAVFQAPEEQS